MVASGSATSGWQPVRSRPVGPTTMVRAVTSQREGQPEPSGPRAASSTRLSGLLRIARPRQWVKNLLVFAAPAAAGVLSHGTVAAHAAGAFGVFCLAASGTLLPQRRPRRRGRPAPPRQAPAPRGRRRRARPPSPWRWASSSWRRAIGLAWWLAGSHLAAGHRRLRGGDHRLLAPPQARARGRPGLCLGGVRAAGHRRGRRHRRPAVGLVHHRVVVRVAAHRDGQAQRRARRAGRAARRAPPHPRRLPRGVPALGAPAGRGGDRDRLLPVGLRTLGPGRPGPPPDLVRVVDRPVRDRHLARRAALRARPGRRPRGAGPAGPHAAAARAGVGGAGRRRASTRERATAPHPTALPRAPAAP